MPVTSESSLSQRGQYAKGGIGRFYWDWRDREALKYIKESHSVILDIGCGEGITLERLRNLYPGKTILGLDVMKENVGICNKHHLPVVLGDFFRGPGASG